jgi:histidyl-tRNA synthetase
VVALLGTRSLDDAAAAAPPGSPARADLRHLFELLDAYGIAQYVDFDASVVRGLAYYTGIVFEAYDAERKLRAVCGGGRYDQLLETLGGPSIPAVGFGFGDVVIAELLADRGLLPRCRANSTTSVRTLGEARARGDPRRRTTARRRSRRRAGARRGRLEGAYFADADKAGARSVWLLGPTRRRGVGRCGLHRHRARRTHLMIPARGRPRANRQVALCGRNSDSAAGRREPTRVSGLAVTRVAFAVARKRYSRAKRRS